MDTGDMDSEVLERLGDDEAGPAHYSTGRLTPVQAEVVDRWRARLLEDRPLPGQLPVPEILRLMGIDNRPRASASDVIAAAVRDLLTRTPPTGLELARYAEAGRLATLHGGPEAAVCQPVSFYLPGDLTEHAEQLRGRAIQDVINARSQLRQEAGQRFSHDQPQQVAWFTAQLTAWACRRAPGRYRAAPSPG